MCVSAHASTLLQLSLDDMIRKSTVVVRGTVQRNQSAVHGSVIYTHYQVRVSEVWKGSAAGPLDIVVPGGVLNGLRETYSGAPSLINGHQYVLFLWTSKTGMTQVIGLSQGLFDVVPNASGELMATRTPASERMLDNTGNDVKDGNLQMRVTDMRTRVLSTLGSLDGK
jgi:hypothetical protein